MTNSLNTQTDMVMRQSAEKVLLEAAASHRRKADNLEILAQIASRLSGEEEAAMWELAIQARR